MNFSKLSNSIENYLKKTIDYNKLSPEEIILVRHNIIPNIISNKDSSFLGSGEYSEVFDVIYNGKNCVAKIAKDFRNIDNLVDLYKIKAALGPLSKHIAEIYDVIEYDEIIDDNRYIGYIILVEKLEPLDPSIKKFLRGSSYFFYTTENTSKNFKDTFDKVIDIYKNPLIYFNYIKSHVESFNINISKKDMFECSNLIVHFISQVLKLSCNNLLALHDFKKKLSTKYVMEEIKKNFFDNKDKLKKILMIIEPTKDFYLAFFNFIFSIIQQDLSEGLDNTYEDAEKFDSFTRYQKYPELKSILKLFKILKENYNVYFADIHDENLMQRPGTKDVVISDPGLFKFK